MLDVKRRNAVARGACAIDGLVNRTLRSNPNRPAAHCPPADHKPSASAASAAERLQFLAAFRGHLHVQLRRAGRMAEFIMLEPGGNRVFAAQDPRAGHNARRNTIRRGQIVGLVIRDRREIRA